MNIRLFCAAALSIFSLHSNAQLTSGLVANWKFNGNAGDSSGNGAHGIQIFMNYGIGKNGIANTAAVFDGSKTYVTVPYQSNMNLGSSYSICAIVKPTGYYTGDCQTNAILWRSAQYTPSHYSLHFYDNAYDNSCASTDTSKNVFAASAGTITGTESQWQYTPTIVTNTWYVVIATLKNDTMRIYVNGQLKSRYVKTSGTTGTSTDGLFIGATYQGTAGAYPYWYKGFIDDLRLYNRALTDDEIRQYSYGLYFTPKPPSVLCKNVTYSTPFNTVNDYMAGNNFTLQLSDATGSFASPTVLNVVAGTQGSSFSYMIPGSVATGSGYKMRIISSQPYSVSDTISVGIGIAATPPTIYSTVGPTNSIPAGTSTFFTAITTNAGATPTFQWKKNGVPIPGADTVSWSSKAGTDYAHLDTITITVKSSVYCATPDTVTSTPIVMYITNTGIDKTAGKYNAHIYPNPADESCTIVADNLENGPADISIYNILGQQVAKESVTVVNNSLKNDININRLATGKYTVRIKNKSNVINLSLTINK